MSKDNNASQSTTRPSNPKPQGPPPRPLMEGTDISKVIKKK